MKHLKIAFCVLATLLIMFSSCKRPKAGTGEAYTTVILNNPLVGGAVSPATNPATYVGFELEITVKTVVGTNATNFSTKVTTYASGASVPSNFTVGLVKIPAYGTYTVEYTLRSLSCSIYNNTCTSGKGKKYYKDIQTFSSAVSSVNFTVSYTNIYTEICC
jgi:hypothetical protein